MRRTLALFLVALCLTPFSVAAPFATESPASEMGDTEPRATLEVGAAFPEIPLPDLHGRAPIGLSAYRGRKVYLMIFASW